MNANLATARPKTGSDRGTLSYIAAYSAVLYMVLLIAPVITSKLVEEFGLSAPQVGALLSLELGAFSMATIPAYLWLRTVNLVTATRFFMLIAVAGNVVSGFVDSFAMLVVCRVLTSLAAGSITVIILSLSGRTANPGRAYGMFVSAQLVMGAVILAVFPMLFAHTGVAAIYWAMAVLGLCCLPFANRIDGRALRVSADKVAAASPAPMKSSVPWYKAAFGLAAVLFFYVALSGVWAFMAQIAGGANIDLSTTSLILAFATIPGIASSLLATVLGDHPRRMTFLLVGYLGMAASVALLFGLSSTLQFILAAVIFKFAWTFILPYLLTSISDIDASGQLMNSTNLMIGSGFALGPILGGMLIEFSGGFTALLVVSFVGVLVSMALATAIQRRRTVIDESTKSKLSPAERVHR